MIFFSKNRVSFLQIQFNFRVCITTKILQMVNWNVLLFSTESATRLNGKSRKRNTTKTTSHRQKFYQLRLRQQQQRQRRQQHRQQQQRRSSLIRLEDLQARPQEKARLRLWPRVTLGNDHLHLDMGSSSSKLRGRVMEKGESNVFTNSGRYELHLCILRLIIILWFRPTNINMDKTFPY